MFTSAFLSSAPNGYVAAGTGPSVVPMLEMVRAGGFLGGNSIIAIVSVPPSSIPGAILGLPINEPQFQKIVHRLNGHGADLEMDLDLTDSLGLTSSGKMLSARKLGIKDKQGIRHGFYRLNDNNGYLLYKETTAGYSYLYTGLDFKPYKAFVQQKGRAPEVKADSHDLMIALYDELCVWAAFADQL